MTIIENPEPNQLPTVTAKTKLIQALLDVVDQQVFDAGKLTLKIQKVPVEPDLKQCSSFHSEPDAHAFTESNATPDNS